MFDKLVGIQVFPQFFPAHDSTISARVNVWCQLFGHSFCWIQGMGPAELCSLFTHPWNIFCYLALAFGVCTVWPPLLIKWMGVLPHRSLPCKGSGGHKEIFYLVQAVQHDRSTAQRCLLGETPVTTEINGNFGIYFSGCGVDFIGDWSKS